MIEFQGFSTNTEILFQILENNCTRGCDLEGERDGCKDICKENEIVHDEIEGSDIVDATMEFSLHFNIFIYIFFLVFTIMIVSYAILLTYRLVAKGRETLSTLALNQGYTPVALG